METPQEQADRLISFAQDALDRGEHAAAAAGFAEAGDVRRSAGEGRATAEALLSAGAAWFHAGEYEACVEAYQAAGVAALEADSAELRTWALYGEADGCAQLGRWEVVAARAEDAIALVRDYGHDGALPALQFLLGKAFYWLDDEQAALSALEQARNNYRSRGAVPSVLDVDDFTLTVLLFLEDYDAAIAVASQRLAASRGLADPTLEANAARRLGEAYLAAGEPAASLDHLERAGAGYRMARWSASGAICDIWLGRAHRALNRPEDALVLFRGAAATLEASGWDSDHRTALDELATTLARLKRHGEAADIDEHLIQLWTEAGSAFDFTRWQRVVTRYFDVLIRLADVDRAASALQHPAFAAEALVGDNSSYAFWVGAVRCWVNWYRGRRLAGLEAALHLLSWDVAVDCGLAQGVVLEVAGRGVASRPDQAELLARAMAVYVSFGSWDQAFALAEHIEEHTPFPSSPRQLWLELTDRAAA